MFLFARFGHAESESVFLVVFTVLGPAGGPGAAGGGSPSGGQKGRGGPNRMWSERSRGRHLHNFICWGCQKYALYEKTKRLGI